MKSRVFFLNPIAKYRCKINESGIGLTGNEVKVIETEPLLAELQAVREALNNLNNACDGKIGCWCGEIIWGETVEVCPRCDGKKL